MAWDPHLFAYPQTREEKYHYFSIFIIFYWSSAIF